MNLLMNKLRTCLRVSELGCTLGGYKTQAEPTIPATPLYRV